MSDGYRCSRDSAALDEPLAGTASTVRAFVLLESPGSWGENALRDSRLPGSLGLELAARCRAAGVRPLLIRRYGRSPATVEPHVFAAYADPDAPWLEEATLARPDDVLELDLGALGKGWSVGLERREQPLFLVCTHGRQDVCCAERGRPVAAALTRTHPEETWECSHIGGDRFAGNLVMLPTGFYYGRVDAESASKIAGGQLAGHVNLNHFRGRSGYSFGVQAAEWHLRSHLGLTAVRAVTLASEARSGADCEAVFVVAGFQRWRVRVRGSSGAARQLTCRSRKERHALVSDLVAIDLLDGSAELS